ncbi:YbaB/EbfC DNA-binding family protein [Actinomyces ruminicola]|uniref:YbaB/EbfC DNA-binding family protein n=1 Tax=Actinomyces ruminicola TaxID=332524 RepID=A0A1H0BIZ4_9ACTO|nr:YbaB/EbfC family nucleoid-associated protein [Actinomyces ruminicola]SDN45634.1 YbaB/EbfC DNA-binding family protein [Actinomyces ruminicola]
MADDIDDAAARAHADIDGWVRQAQERAEASQRLAKQVEALRETEVSRDRAISVTVDAAGRLVDLKLREPAMDFTPGDLAAAIMRAVQRASGRAGERTARMAAEVWGEDSAVAQRVRQAYTGGEDGAAPQSQSGSGSGRRPGASPRRPGRGGLIDPTGSLGSFGQSGDGRGSRGGW